MRIFALILAFAIGLLAGYTVTERLKRVLPVHTRHFVNGSLWAARSNALARIEWGVRHASNDAEIATLRMMEYGLTNGPVTDRTP